MFPSTQPMHPADSRPPPAPHTALSSLSPSLLQDLLRFENSGPQRELLEVLAACVRHTQAAGHHRGRTRPATAGAERVPHRPAGALRAAAGRCAGRQPGRAAGAGSAAGALARPRQHRGPPHRPPRPLRPAGPVAVGRGAARRARRPAARAGRPGGLPGVTLASAWAGSPCPARWPPASPACAATPATCARSPAGPTWARSAPCGC
jgi:hypothetical protein